MIREPIISLTTIPERVAHIEQCLQSLNEQGPEVHLFIALRNQRLNSRFDRLPDFVNELCIVHFRVGADLGPAMKLIPALSEGYEQVIVADDDRIYADGWAQGLIHASERFPDCAVAWRGRKLHESGQYNKCKPVQCVKTDTKVDLVTNVWGAFYRREMFSDSFIADYSFSGAKDDPAYNDDLMISRELMDNGVPLIVAGGGTMDMCRETEVSEIARLSDSNGKGTNPGGMNNEFIRKLFPERLK